MRPPLEELFESSLSLSAPDKTLRQLPSGRGTLLFADKNNCPIQLLSVSSLRRTALAKLDEPKPEQPLRKADLRPIASVVYYTPISSEFHCSWFYNRLVHILFPEKVDHLISLPPPHCVRIAPDEKWASFAPSTHPGKDPSAVYFGPFPTRKAADLFAQTFNNLFVLCRNCSFALSRQGEKCSYYQMGLCTGPCLDTDREVQYRRTVQESVQAASGPLEDLQEQFSVRMNRFAGKMQFEQAQAIKDQLNRLSKLKGNAYGWTRRLEALKILHIAPGSYVFTAENFRQKSPHFCAYVITAFQAEKVPNFSFHSIRTFLDTLPDPPRTCRLTSNTLSEHLALTSLFLYKSHPPGLWMDLHEQAGLNENTFMKAFDKRFSKKPCSEKE